MSASLVLPVATGFSAATAAFVAEAEGLIQSGRVKGFLLLLVGELEGPVTVEEPDAGAAAETALPEIWVVRRAAPVRMPVTDVPDPSGVLTAPGALVPRVEELVFSGLTLIGKTGSDEGGGTGTETDSVPASHSTTSTNQTGCAG